MLNLIKSDIYKLTKARYFLICMAVNIILAAGTVFLLDFSYKLNDTIAQHTEISQQTLNENGLNVDTEGIPKNYDDLDASGQMLTFFAGSNTILIAILISLFVGGEFTYGTIKNIASKNYSREKIYLSKLFVAILSAVLFTLIYTAVASLTAAALWGFGDVSGGFIPHLLKAGAIELLLVSAFASIFVMFSMFVRQNGGAIALNLCVLEFTSVLIMLGEMLAKNVFHKTVTLSDYMIDTNMSQIALKDLTPGLVTRSLCVGISFLAVSAAIGMITFRKRDIK